MNNNYVPYSQYMTNLNIGPTPVVPIPPTNPWTIKPMATTPNPNFFEEPFNSFAPRVDQTHLISEIMSIEHSNACGQITFSPSRIVNAVGIVVDYIDNENIPKTASTIAGTPIRYGYEGDISELKRGTTTLQSLNPIEYRNIVSVTDIRIVHDIPLIINNTIGTMYAKARSSQELERYIFACTHVNCSFLFQECENLREISTLQNTPIVRADFMFAGCSELNSDIIFNPALVSCVGAFAGCKKMNGIINFSSNPNISGIFYGTARSVTNKVHGLDINVLLNNFTHLIQPYTDLMSAHATEFDPPCKVQRSSGWGEVDINIFASPEYASGSDSPQTANEKASDDNS